MERKVTVQFRTLKRAKEFVDRISPLNCEVDMLFGKTALEARYLDNLAGLDMGVPQRILILLIYGDNVEVMRAEEVVAEYL